MTTNPTLADLATRATESRNKPAYGHDALITCDRLVRIFTTDGVEVQALQGLDLLVREGELMALVGASGSGKSTLMNILAGLDTPTAGAARVAGRDLLTMTAKDRLAYRREVVGFVWQQTSRNLLPYLTAAQNIALPMQLSGIRSGRRAKAERALELLELLEVADCRDRRPQEMSGGQQQRVAIGVALANAPAVLLADEPTGELDSHTAEQVFAAFRTANEQLGTTIVIVTHDQAVATEVRRTVAIRDGRCAQRTLTPSVPTPALRTAIEPYGVRSRSHAPDEKRPNSPPGRRNPSDWAAWTARTGSEVSPTVRDQISRPTRSSSARVRVSGVNSCVRERNSATPAAIIPRSACGPGRPDSGVQPRRGGSTPAHGGPVTAAGTPAVAANSSRVSRSSPAETVTSRVTSRPFSYGLARRTARMARTSKDGGRPKTARAVPAAWRRTAAPRS
jgi:putative ABC transport system ATP-binding protein